MILIFLSGLQSSEGGLEVAPHSPGATTVVRSPADHRGSDIGFLCNNGGPAWLAQWVMEENTVRCMRGMPLLQGPNIVQASGFYFIPFRSVIIAVFLRSKRFRSEISMAAQMCIGHRCLLHPN